MTPIRYYDAHAHLADSRVAAIFPAIMATARQQQVAGIIVTPARRHEWNLVLGMRHEPEIHIALGVHPGFLSNWSQATLCELQQHLQTTPEICAIGEIGLDFTDGRQQQALQIQAFEQQLQLAVDAAKPVILHNRKSWNEFFAIWHRLADGHIAGVCHHFTGSKQIAREALDAGLYLSFCGPLTYTNACRIKAAAAYAPRQRILCESDTPDLPIAAELGAESRPQHVAAIVAELARLQNIEPAAMAEQIEANFHRLLSLS